MMFDLNYNDRLTWLKTLLLFDIERNVYLTPFLGKSATVVLLYSMTVIHNGFLGECHDLVTSNDSVIFHIPTVMETDDSNYRQGSHHCYSLNTVVHTVYVNPYKALCSSVQTFSKRYNDD